MKIVCAWCKKSIGEKPPLADTEITRDVCPDCKTRLENEHEIVENLKDYWACSDSYGYPDPND